MSPSDALSAIRNNEIDIIAQFHKGYFPQELKGPRAQRRLYNIKYNSNHIRTILFNVKSRILKDRRVRTALIHMVDREALIKIFRNGKYREIYAILAKASDFDI